MVNITLKVGPKGQIVIPKVIRESLGIIENKTITLEVKQKSMELKLAEGMDLINKWEEQAKRYGKNISKQWVYGDRLYEEEF